MIDTYKLSITSQTVPQHASYRDSTCYHALMTRRRLMHTGTCTVSHRIPMH